MQGGGAWGRVDLRCEVTTGEIYCLELNHMPALFYSKDDKLSDDVIIRETYPGGHEAFIEMLLFTKKFQISQGKSLQEIPASTEPTKDVPIGPIGDFKTQGKTIAEVYDNAADMYDDIQAKMDIRAWQINYFASHDYSGTVLDLACGTGGVGMVIHQTNPTALISGVDVSAHSLQKPYVLQHYTQPITVGFMQNEIWKYKENSFDHIVCFGALHFLDRTEFMAVVARMFSIASKSIAFDVDDVDDTYINAIVKCFGEGLRNHNNTVALQRFGVPNGWKKVVDERQSLFYSPSIHTTVFGQLVRFEKI
jgi:SAM-dependent methyltransferase